MPPTKNRSRYARGKSFTPQLDWDGHMQNYWPSFRDDQVVVSTLYISDSHSPQTIEEAISAMDISSVEEQVLSAIWHRHGERKRSSNQLYFEDSRTYRHGSTVELWSHQRQLKGGMPPQSNALTDVEVEEWFAGLTVGFQPTVFLVRDDPSPEVISPRGR